MRAGSAARFIFIGCGVICLHAAALWLVNVDALDAPAATPPFVVLMATPQLPPNMAPAVAQPVKPTTQVAQAPRTQKPVKDIEIPAKKPAAANPASVLAATDTLAPAAVANGSTPSLMVAPANLPMQTPERSAQSFGAVTGTDKPMSSVQLPSSNADYLNNPAPVYPALSQRLGEQGKVVIRVLIGKDGTARQADIQQSSGFDRLDQAALRAVMGWRYVPGQRGGIAQDMWFNVPVNFSLN